MRRVILWMSVSLDGCFAGPGGELDWQVVDEELHTFFNAELGGMGAFLDGRITYELMAEYWPHADEDPSSSPAVAEFARIWREMPKMVFSRTLTTAAWNTTVVREVVPEQIMELKAQPGGDLVVGGGQLAATFLTLGLADELRLYVQPIVLGQGRPLFPSSLPPFPLRLEETRTFAGGVVRLRYSVLRSAGLTQ